MTWEKPYLKCSLAGCALWFSLIILCSNRDPQAPAGHTYKEENKTLQWQVSLTKDAKQITSSEQLFIFGCLKLQRAYVYGVVLR